MASTEEDIAWLKSTFHPIPKPALPDDCIEYSLYVIDSNLDQSNKSETRLQLKDVQKYANELQKQWLKEYIWQRQCFNLELLTENDLSFLRGRTEYGDSIEDEWVIVWLLRELTRKFSNLWVKVTDSDGEFLLIEASGTLPAWLEPEVAENRVWINDGQLKIIRPAGSSRSSKRTDEKLTLQEAHRIVLSDPKRIIHSTSMEEEGFYRLRNYPAQIKDNMHHAIVQLPRKVAYLLLQKPAYVAPAIEAFYLRDPISLKPLQAKNAAEELTFPPKDLIEFSVKFPRVAYAQIKSQDFSILDAWKSAIPPPSEPQSRAQAETGMKLTCGFEMLLSDPQYQDRQHVREMLLLLEDLESGDASLPSEADLGNLEKHADDEKWMDIDFGDLQQELNRGTGQDGEGRQSKKAQFGDKAAQENLQRIVKQFESFLNDDKMGDEASGLYDEGDSDTDELDDSDSDDLEEDKEASFDEDEFSKIMQEMMGMPPEVMKEVISGKIDALSNGTAPQAPLVPTSTSKVGKQVEELSSDEEQEDEEIEELTRRIGAELRASGALDLESPTAESSRAVEGKKSDVIEQVDTSDEDEDDPEYQRKEEIAKNLLDSLRSQGGAAGPAGNLMALMAEQYAADDKQKKGKGVTRGKNIPSDPRIPD